MSAQLQAALDDARQLTPMTVTHLDAVVAVERAAYPFPWTRGNFVDALAAGHEASVLGCGDRRLAGYFVVMAGVEEMHLLNLTVAPDAQGLGNARFMLGDIVARCRRIGARQLWLEVRGSNTRARGIYRRFGFTDIGLRKAYYPAPEGQREDAIVMALNIAASEASDGLD
jgi:ribosomal-protein-alanine N-acetyltransferase